MSPQYDPSLRQNGDDSHPAQTLSKGHSNDITNGYHPRSTQASPNEHGLHPNPKKQHHNRSRYLVPSLPNSEFDLICVGFGPASLAVAVALHDSLATASSSSSPPPPPKVLFVEKQSSFAWHAGMLLPGAKMQISFIKDLATLRDPRSEFTFLNYLHSQGRLVDFTNLGTFLPARVEYEDYLRWSASFFDEVVRYDQQVVSIAPEKEKTAAAAAGEGVDEVVRMFTVKAANVRTGETESFRGRNVLVAAGGQPSMPKMLPTSHSRVIHSSQYANHVSRLLPDAHAPYRIAVMGAGQSAAEIFHNAQRQYPNAQVWLIMRQEFLRPSDDSPLYGSPLFL
jgi:L-ornithine N5-oxygenase